MNVFELSHVIHQILDHQICSIQLLHQQILLIVAGLLLPLNEGAEQGSHVIVFTQSKSQSLTCNIVLKKTISLNSEIFDLLIHSFKSVLRASNG